MKSNMTVKDVVSKLSALALLAAGTFGDACAQEIAASKSTGDLGKLVITFFEMPKHGIAIAVQTPKGKTYLVDTGIVAGGHDTGRDIIAPFLRAHKIAEIDGIVHTHPHEDHYGGTAYLLQHFKVKRVIDSGYDKGVHKVV